MKTKTYFLLSVGLLGLMSTALHAQVAINNSATNPDASAILDLNSGNAGANKGFLAPQVALTNVATASPVTSPATGLMVYSTSAPAGGNGVGYYYWNGSAWTTLSGAIAGSGSTSQVTFWNGANTLTSSSNLYWNNSSSYLGIGTSAPSQPLDVNESNVATTAKFGAAEPVCLVANSPMIGFNAYWSALLYTYYSSGYAGMLTFNQGVSGGFQFLTAPSGTALAAATMTPAMTIVNSGFIGIGTVAPSSPLHVVAVSGIGIYGEGGGALGAGGAYGEGVYGEGKTMGVYGYADNASGIVWPVYGANGYGKFASLCEYYSGTDYKVYGTGTVSTNVKDNNNQWRIMNCPEAPEILFEDYGSATLSGGKVHINLDPIFAKNVTINSNHALRVMITLNDACNGVYVTNRTATGFDVIELNGGTSSASFTYEVIANRADVYDDNGNLTSKNADNRFVIGHGPLNITGTTTENNAPKN